jgi:hypothetical protein
MKRTLVTGGLVVVWALTGLTARAADPTAIDKAIERGVAFLHGGGAANLDSNATAQPVGASALVGLTLLECGAGPDDVVVHGIAAMVRPASINMHETYSLALSILFLDRLGEPTDVPLIESMTVRLLAGQGSIGGWTYECPAIGEAEVRRLTAHLKQQTEGIGKRERPKEGKEDKDHDDKPLKRSVKDLPKEIQDQLRFISPAIRPGAIQDASDNSNTQFATVALWVGRRQGLPVEKAMARLDQRFRATQNPDGGWSYNPGGGGGSTATMTCAGLLGLAVAHGSAAEVSLEKGKAAADPGKDRAIKAGLALLGTAVGKPAGKRPFGAPPVEMPSAIGGKSYYAFWSLERVAVALDLKTIGGKDWYAWGADVLLANQGQDGSWQGEYAAKVDTCFALLFLKRANLASDLTARLKGKLQDPGEVTLKAGGAGDDLLKEPAGFKSALEPKDDPAGIGKPAKNPVEGRLPPSADTEGALMARELFQAPAERRGQLIEKYRDGKGVPYTEALAGAIPQMDGEAKGMARDALAERLTRMKADTLVRYFQDQDAEIRRAAALAAAMKEDKALIPALITLLDDAEPTVTRAAHAALKDLSGEKIGPSSDEWKAWWKKREGK